MCGRLQWAFLSHALIDLPEKISMAFNFSSPCGVLALLTFQKELSSLSSGVPEGCFLPRFSPVWSFSPLGASVDLSQFLTTFSEGRGFFPCWSVFAPGLLDCDFQCGFLGGGGIHISARV